jgi:hypothetical protein
MSKQAEIPTTIFVPQAPSMRNADQLDVWLRALAGFVNGCQRTTQKTSELGTLYSTRVGPFVFVQGVLETPEAAASFDVLPVVPLFDSHLVCCASDGSLKGAVISAGLKTINTSTLATATRYTITGAYLADSALKNKE